MLDRAYRVQYVSELFKLTDLVVYTHQRIADLREHLDQLSCTTWAAIESRYLYPVYTRATVHSAPPLLCSLCFSDDALKVSKLVKVPWLALHAGVLSSNFLLTRSVSSSCTHVSLPLASRYLTRWFRMYSQHISIRRHTLRTGNPTQKLYRLHCGVPSQPLDQQHVHRRISDSARPSATGGFGVLSKPICR